MNMMKSNMRSTAIAAVLTLPLATGTAFAQQSQSTDQSQQSAQSGSSGTSGQSMSGDQQPDALVATVGDAEIRGSDVMTVIGMLPPRLQSQPPEMLVPIALQQLIFRELILEQARAQNLADDPEVVALVEGSAQGAEEDAMVQVWIDRETANAVTEDAVLQVYGTLQPQGDQPVPQIEELRPQIEQHLRQQAMQEIQTRLQQDADIILYDPSGQPVAEDQSQSAVGGSRGTSGSGSGSDQSGSGSTGATSGGQTSNN